MKKPKPITIKVGERTLQLQFEHTTVCDLLDENGTIAFTGLTNCSYSDPFNKEAGNKHALARAIRDLPRATRMDIWNAYLVKAGLCWPTQVAANSRKAQVRALARGGQ